MYLPAIAMIGLLSQTAAASGHEDTAHNPAGRGLYVANCAACHGSSREGQPNWRSPDANGMLPAPPHHETGHTWHHDDAMLIDYVTRGGQAVLDDMGVNFTSGMPGFAETLERQEVEPILAYIRSTWPEDIRKTQAERSRAVNDTDD